MNRKQAAITKKNVTDAFRRTFKTMPEFVVRTPGRVNILGDYAYRWGGCVLSCTLDSAVWLAVRRRTDDIVRVYSYDYNEEGTFALLPPLTVGKAHEGWLEYIKGCAWVWQTENLPLCGFDAIMLSNIQQGAELGSSTAIEVSMFLSFARLAGIDVPTTDVTHYGCRVSSEWVKSRYGITDYLTCAAGQEGKAILIDKRGMSCSFLELLPETSLAIVDTAVRDTVACEDYEQRLAQCAEALKILGIEQIIDAEPEMLAAARPHMTEDVFRRARHMIAEDLRVKAAYEALSSHKAVNIGKLINESHFSLQYDLEISSFELDALTTIARGHPACLGARMVGDGCMLVLVNAAQKDDFETYIARHYRQQTGKAPAVAFCQPTKGGHIETL